MGPPGLSLHSLGEGGRRVNGAGDKEWG